MYYNWSNLSDHDFEGVCRDLLAAELGEDVEAFAAGRDGGVDLRCEVGSQLVIGQCKHYLRSTYTALLASLKAERGKMQALKPRPNRYVLYTSMSLSPARKREIKSAMSPFIRRLGDVVGLEDLEGRLVSYPQVERKHYKLWLASSEVLERIVGNAARTRSEIRVESILEKAKLFVPHARLDEAIDILDREHCLIISGDAGIGKTTMAEMLSQNFWRTAIRLHSPPMYLMLRSTCVMTRNSCSSTTTS